MRRSGRREDASGGTSSSSRKRSALGAPRRRDDTRRRRTESTDRAARSRYYQSSRSPLPTASPLLLHEPGAPPHPALDDSAAPFSPFSGSNPFADDTAARRLQLFWTIRESKKERRKKQLLAEASLARRRQFSVTGAGAGDGQEEQEDGEECREDGNEEEDGTECRWSRPMTAADTAAWQEESAPAAPTHRQSGRSPSPRRRDPSPDQLRSGRSPARETPPAASETPPASPHRKHHGRSHTSCPGDDAEAPGCCTYVLTFLSYLLVVLTPPFSICFCVKVVQEYERAVIFRLGRLRSGGARGPGIFFVLPCIDTCRSVDLRTVSVDVPPQEILSKDCVTVSVSAAIYFRVVDPVLAVTSIDNYSACTRLLAATTLRTALGTRPLSDLLAQQEDMLQLMVSGLHEATAQWGVLVERVAVRDVRLPGPLQRAMAAEAAAVREARARLVAADGERQASQALREAADVIGDSPGALQLRYLHTLNAISAEQNSTIIIPLPMDILQHLTSTR